MMCISHPEIFNVKCIGVKFKKYLCISHLL